MHRLAGARACARVDVLDPVPDFRVATASGWSRIGDWRPDCSDCGALTVHVWAAGLSHANADTRHVFVLSAHLPTYRPGDGGVTC